MTARPELHFVDSGQHSRPPYNAASRLDTYLVEKYSIPGLSIYQAGDVRSARRTRTLLVDVVQDELRERHIVARGHERRALRAEYRHGLEIVGCRGGKRVRSVGTPVVDASGDGGPIYAERGLGSASAG